MFILPPPFPTGKPHLGHATYLVKIDAMHRAISNQKYIGPLIFGYDCHGIPTKCKINKLSKTDSQKNTLGKRFTVEGIKQFENLCALLNFSQGVRWSTADLMFQIFVDKWVKAALRKKLLKTQMGLQQYCVYCEQYLSHSELGVKIEQKYRYRINWEIGNKIYAIYTTKPQLIYNAVALVFPETPENRSLAGKLAKISTINLKVPVILDDNFYDSNKSGDGCMISFCGQLSDYEFIMKHKLQFKNYLDVENRTYFGNPFSEIQSTKLNLIQQLLQKNAIVKQDKIESNSVIHTERSSCQKSIEYHYSLQYYIDVVKIRPEILLKLSGIQIYPEKYRSRLINWINNTKKWNIGRKYSWCSEMLLTTEEKLEIGEYVPLYLDGWVDSSITWYYTKYLANYSSVPEVQFQGYEILTTWAYYSIISAVILQQKLPFKVLRLTSLLRDESGKKYSKSSPGYRLPADIINEHGIFAYRLWAVLLQTDSDTIFSESLLIYSKRVVNKLQNIIKFSRIYEYKNDTKVLEVDLVCQLQKVHAEYVQTLATVYKHELSDIINMVYKCSNYISENYKTRESTEFRYTVNKMVQLFIQIFEPILATKL